MRRDEVTNGVIERYKRQIYRAEVRINEWHAEIERLQARASKPRKMVIYGLLKRYGLLDDEELRDEAHRRFGLELKGIWRPDAIFQVVAADLDVTEDELRKVLGNKVDALS